MAIKPKAPALLKPWQLPPIDAADIFALQALANGNANAVQQKRALEFVVSGLAEEHRMSFYPGGDDGRRASDFAEGKRWVGSQIRRILKLRPKGLDTETK